MKRNFPFCMKAEKDGNTYCYDADNSRWVVITERVVPFELLPHGIVLSVPFKEALLDGAISIPENKKNVSR